MMRTSIGAFGFAEVLTLFTLARRAALKRHRYRCVAAVEPFDHRPIGAARTIGHIRGILGALP